METCYMPACYDEVHYNVLGLCRACYAGKRYWANRPTADKERRLAQLERLDGRMRQMLESGLK